MLRSLVGSEMCIRDRYGCIRKPPPRSRPKIIVQPGCVPAPSRDPGCVPSGPRHAPWLPTTFSQLALGEGRSEDTQLLCRHPTTTQLQYRCPTAIGPKGQALWAQDKVNPRQQGSILGERVQSLAKDKECLGKPQENHRKTTGKPQENHRKTVGQPQGNHRKTTGKP